MSDAEAKKQTIESVIQELDAMGKCAQILDPMTDESRHNVVMWLWARFCRGIIAPMSVPVPVFQPAPAPAPDPRYEPPPFVAYMAPFGPVGTTPAYAAPAPQYPAGGWPGLPGDITAIYSAPMPAAGTKYGIPPGFPPKGE